MKNLEKWFSARIKKSEKNPRARAYKHMLRFTGAVSERLQYLNMTQSALAKKLKVNKTWVSRFLNAQPNTTIETLERVAGSVGLTLEIRVMPNEAVMRDQESYVGQPAAGVKISKDSMGSQIVEFDNMGVVTFDGVFSAQRI